jgi:hypothetical protein
MGLVYQVVTSHKSLCDEQEDVDRVQAVVDVFPERCEDHNRLSVRPGKVIVVVTYGRDWEWVTHTHIHTQ